MTDITVRTHMVDTTFGSVYGDGEFLGMVKLLAPDNYHAYAADKRCAMGCGTSKGCGSQQGCKRGSHLPHAKSLAVALAHILGFHKLDPKSPVLTPDPQLGFERKWAPRPSGERKERVAVPAQAPMFEVQPPAPIARMETQRQLTIEEHLDEAVKDASR